MKIHHAERDDYTSVWFNYVLSSQPIAAIDAEAASHTIVFAAHHARSRRIREGLGTLGAEWRPNLVWCFALGAGNFLGDPLRFEVPLDFLGSEVAVVNLFGQVDTKQLEKPSVLRRNG